jgi:predicted ATPase
LALKDAVRRFESAWRQGTRPRIDDYLVADASVRSSLLVELVHIELELRLKSSETARVEDYLKRYPELAGDRTVILELIAAEQELRGRREPSLTVNEYLQRFPQHSSALQAQFARPTIAAKGMKQDRADSVVEPPPEVEGYEILSLLGRGGMGVVYKARQHSLDRLVALKFLPEECARDPVWLARFRREARTASALNHPHICTIYDTGECAGRPFLSMELVEGQTLEALINRRLPMEELARLLRQAARALAAAHAAGVVHRDIKPANLMVRADGILKILDFGLARRFSEAGVPKSQSSFIGTDVGIRVGTLLYMSPEQARAEAVEAATDIFSLGLVLYELAAGQHPFRADSDIGVMQALVDQMPAPPSRLNPEVPAALEALALHMLTKDPQLRPTALEVAAALSEINSVVSGKPGIRPLGPISRPTVGREQERVALRAGFEAAAAGHGSLLCVTGEPGLGKTTLIESFLDELATSGRTWSLGRGRCSERLAGAEAYLPFLEALDSLLHGEHGAVAARTMKLLAPSWYVQLAPLAADDPSLAGVLAEAKSASQEHRKRELGVFLHELSRHRPLVIFLDDIHWADPSSVDLLAYLGNKCPDWRFLLVLTYRPSDLLRSRHPFGPIKLELQGRGSCREIALPFLSRDDIVQYLSLTFAGHQFPEDLAAALHARTEGNPLFMVDLLRYLRDRGVIVQDNDCWALVRAVPDLQRELPESVRAMIQRKVDQLGAADRHLLMAASVQGPEFDSAVVALLLGQEAADVEERLDVLERVYALVRMIGERTLPDGTLTVRYGFVHALYQNALYAALKPTRKASWSAAAARALLSQYGEKSGDRAADLAVLFEAARDPEKAADYNLVAAENAARIFAHHEAVSLARRGLAQLQLLPDLPDRARRELRLQVTLGLHLQLAQGYAVPELAQIYAHARALCERVQETPLFFPVLRGSWAFHLVRSEHDKSRNLAERLFALAEKSQDPAQILQARQALAVTFFFLGDQAVAREHVEQGIAIYDPSRHSGQAYIYGQDPGVICLAFGAVVLWLLGYPDQAVRRSREAVALSEQLRQPGSLALALFFAAMLRQYRRDGPAVLKFSEAAMAISTEHGLTLWLASGLIMSGWALAEQGTLAGGMAQLRQGLAHWAATGSETNRSYYLALLADALSRDGLIEEGLAKLDEALALYHGSGEGFHRAELHRLRGEFILRQQPDGLANDEVEACFRQALKIAHQQQAKSLELRAAISLTRLHQKQGRPAEALSLLADCFDWFTEGFDTPDLQEAKALLDGRGPAPQ